MVKSTDTYTLTIHTAIIQLNLVAKGTGKSYACYLSIEAEHGKQQVCWTLTIGTLMKFQDLPFLFHVAMILDKVKTI